MLWYVHAAFMSMMQIIWIAIATCMHALTHMIHTLGHAKLSIYSHVCELYRRLDDALYTTTHN